MKIFLSFILSALFFSASAFADQPGSSLDDRPSVDTAASSQAPVPATNYLYDLKKLIEKSRENIKEVNQKIKEQAVLKRNQKREERARQYYDKGVELTNEGKLDEARDYFEKAIRITEHPEMSGYIRESQRRLRKQESALQAQENARKHQIKQGELARKEDVEAAYKEAVDLYKQKKYHPAKDAFEHVDEIAPDYRATGSYLKIIDQDIITADALAAKQQAVEVQRQQKEAEAARVKEKAMWLAQIAEKEKQRKEAIKAQAEEVYGQAVELYKNKKFAGAKKKFEEVSWVIPDYKATMKYLARIDRDAQQEQERAARQQAKALQEQRWEEEVARKKQETQKQEALKAKERQHIKDLQEQAQFLYKAAVTLFSKKDMDGASEKFNDIEKLLPDFKSTRIYIARVEQWKFDQQKQQAEAQKKAQKENLRQKKLADKRQRAQELKNKTAPRVVAVKTSVKPNGGVVAVIAGPKGEAISPEDQQKQAQDIAALAEQSAQLYRQIADIADDSSMVQTKKKMAEVNKVLNNLKEERQQKESRAKQEEHRAEAKKMYQEAQKYLRSHEYKQAKIKFLALENIIPDYKNTRRYLSRIEEDLKKADVEKANAKKMRRAWREQEEQRQIEQQQQAALKELAGKASDINDDIIRLSKARDYKGLKAKFTELKNTVTALTTLKREGQRQKKLTEELEHQKRLYEQAKAQAQESTREKKYHQEVLRQQEEFQRQERQRQAQLNNWALPPIIVSSVVENNRAPSPMITAREKKYHQEVLRQQEEFQRQERQRQAQLEARREVVRKQLDNGIEGMYQDALQLYNQGKYSAAADRFKDVQEFFPGYKHAGQYMDEARQKSSAVSKALDLFESQ